MKKVITLLALVFASTTASASWHAHTHTDEFSGKKHLVVYEGSVAAPSALMTCNNGQIALALISHKYLSNKRNVRYDWRVGEHTDWATGLGNGNTLAVFAPQESLISNMKAGNELIVRFHDYNRDTHVRKFNLSGFTKAYNTLAAQCK